MDVTREQRLALHAEYEAFLSTMSRQEQLAYTFRYWAEEQLIKARAVPAPVGVVDFKKAEQTLCDAVQLLTGWHADIAWTDWDEDVKDRCVDLLKQLGAVVKLQSDLSAPVAPAPVAGEPCTKCHWKLTAVDEEDLMALCHPCKYSAVHVDNFKEVKDEPSTDL